MRQHVLLKGPTVQVVTKKMLKQIAPHVMTKLVQNMGVEVLVGQISSPLDHIA